MCEVSLCQGIDAQTVATTLALAEQHHFARLKGACLRFIASRDVLAVVMKTGIQASSGKLPFDSSGDIRQDRRRSISE